jgi:hypothetical protein
MHRITLNVLLLAIARRSATVRKVGRLPAFEGGLWHHIWFPEKASDPLDVEERGGQVSLKVHLDKPAVALPGRITQVRERLLRPDIQSAVQRLWGEGFGHDLVTGITSRVSVDSAGNQGNAGGGGPGIDTGGRHVAFQSEASNLVPGDTNGVTDVFVHERSPVAPVGGIAEYPDVAAPSDDSGASARDYVLLAVLAAVAAGGLGAAGWCARRRWLRRTA